MKFIYKISVVLMSIGLCLWAGETIFFLIRDGWHFDATDSIEKMLDKISLIIVRVGFLIWLTCAGYLVDRVFKNL